MTQEEKARAYDEALERAMKLYAEAKANEYASDVEDYEFIFPELRENEDERIRKAILNFIKVSQEVKSLTTKEYSKWIDWLEKKKTTNDEGDFARGYDCGYECCLHSHGAEWFEKQKEQKPAESDAIKGGDFISDGKRVFLVLANVKERNLGETGSTFCEGLILGVDGAVYCNEDDFKKFKRATSNERAKFIHDLKVGVELKEQPAEWSDTDMKEARSNLISVCIDWERGEQTTLLPIAAVRARYFLEHLTEPKPTKQDSEEMFDKIDDSFRRGREVGFREGVESYWRLHQ